MSMSCESRLHTKATHGARSKSPRSRQALRGRKQGNRGADPSGLDIRVLGVCTGAGVNELDCALVWYRQDVPSGPLRVELIQYSAITISPKERIPILNALRDAQNQYLAVPHLNNLVGGMFSRGIISFCRNHDIDLTSIDLVGAHTPSLRRPRTPETDNWNTPPSGWNSTITNETGITAVIDFIVIESAIPRPQLSPTAFVDKLFLRHPQKFRACLNIGELATLTFIPPLSDSDAGGTKSRDCGPGSLLIDYAVRYCTSNSHGADYTGEYATPGKINQGIVERFLATHDYLRCPPPLIIAREMFGDHEAQRLIDECLFLNMSEADTVATITRVTAQNIVKQYHRLLSLSFPGGQKVDELFICGPSARNSNIIDFLESELPESIITRPLDDIGVPGDANEAVSYAHLALEAVLGQATRPSVAASPVSTRVNDDDVYGNIAYGHTCRALLAKVQKFSEGKPLKLSKDIRCAAGVKTAIKT